MRVVFLAVAFLSACSFSLAEDVTPPPGYQAPQPQAALPTVAAPIILPQQAPDPAAGAAIYAESCAPCHGVTGLGDGVQAAQLPNPATALGDPEVAREAVPLEWYRVVTQGRLDRFMPPFANVLSDTERWDVVAYALSLSSPPGTQAQAADLYKESCAACHGPAGAGDGPQAATLGVQLPNFLDPAALAEQPLTAVYQAITAGVAPAMPAYQAELSESDRWALAELVRTLAYASTEVETAQEPSVSPAETEEPGSAAVEDQEPAAVEVAGIPSGTVAGRVVNGSGGEVPSNLEVTLHGFDHIQEVLTTTTTIQADGSYTFEAVEMPEARIFMATVEYGHSTYNSDLAIVQGDMTSINLPVVIYETTTETASLVVDRLHIFYESGAPGLLQVTELYLISNPSDQVVVAAEEGQPVVTYTLPQGAENLRFQSGVPEGRFVMTTNGFGDTAGIPPGMGQFQVMYAYDMPYDRKLDLEQRLSLPVNSVILLMPEMGVRLRSDQLQDEGSREIQGEIFQIYTSGSLSAGSQLNISLSGRMRGAPAAAVDLEPNNNLVVGLAVFGLTLVGAGVWFFRRGQRRTLQDSPSVEVPDLDGDPDTLLDAIIALDDLYQAGELPQEAYHERRAELKDRLQSALRGG